MGNNYLLKSSLVFALLLVFCVKAMSQGPDNIPVEGSKFYQENGVTGNNKNFTRGDNDALWTFTSVVEHCFDKTKEGQKAWLMTADGETKLKVILNTILKMSAMPSSRQMFRSISMMEMICSMMITNSVLLMQILLVLSPRRLQKRRLHCI